MELDSYADAGAVTSVDLVNELVPRDSRAAQPAAGQLSRIAEILAADPPSVAALRDEDVPGFVTLAQRLREVFDDLRDDDTDRAANRLNDLLSQYLAHPHLAKEGERWRLHHHPANADLVPMYTAICAEALARLIGAGYGDRLGTCAATDCGRVFIDVSKNGSRRFCSTTCQNRVKAATFRRRRLATP